MNHATLSRAGPLVSRWKSSRINAASPSAVNSLTSSGKRMSTMRDAPSNSGDVIAPSVGHSAAKGREDV